MGSRVAKAGSPFVHSQVDLGHNDQRLERQQCLHVQRRQHATNKAVGPGQLQQVSVYPRDPATQPHDAINGQRNGRAALCPDLKADVLAKHREEVGW